MIVEPLITPDIVLGPVGAVAHGRAQVITMVASVAPVVELSNLLVAGIAGERKS